MEREYVNSEMMISRGYDASASILEIEFKGGEVWQYYDFPEYLYEEMRNSDSQGKFWHAHIKGQYSEFRVG